MGKRSWTHIERVFRFKIVNNIDVNTGYLLLILTVLGVRYTVTSVDKFK